MDAMNPASTSKDAAKSASTSAYDEPYRFGRRPTARAPFPFTEQQFARLLILRGRVRDVPSELDRHAA